MIYMLVPHAARSRLHIRMFANYSVAEQTALTVARALEAEGKDPEWCEIIAYDGLDEMYPVFIYTLFRALRLHREPWPSPSS
jgi:hypothetical protein